jgi:hypothetical protein
VVAVDDDDDDDDDDGDDGDWCENRCSGKLGGTESASTLPGNLGWLTAGCSQ